MAAGKRRSAADAYRTVAANCALTGDQVRRLKRVDSINQRIRYLAGTSPEYQRHVVDRHFLGDRDPFRLIGTSLLVYDTVGFHEVVSRLHRAVGGIRKEVRYLTGLPTSDPPARLSDHLLTLKLIVEQSTALLRMLHGLSVIADFPGVPRRSQQSKVGTAAAAATADQLYAAAALGLIAKNVRNVAVLQDEHRSTAEEQQLAIALTEEARKLAGSAVDAMVRSFGHADKSCRLRPKRQPNQRVITHSQPDGDAIVAAWLAERYLFDGTATEVLFVPRGRVLGAYRIGDCLVDVGNTFDPDHHFYDHKPPAFPSRHDSCAAKLVWEHLMERGEEVRHLQELVLAVFAGDSTKARSRFAEELHRSKTGGFHAALATAKKPGNTDADTYRRMRGWLDKHCARPT